MRKLVICTLAAVLAALLIARSLLPAPAEHAMATVPAGYGYNILSPDRPVTGQTAGSAMIAEMNDYYFVRVPTAKSAWTGLLRGRSLILVCADAWTPDPADKRTNPTLYKLWRDGARLTQVYRPDWYQGAEGREFALLTGLMPTRVNDTTALRWIGEQDICLPFTLARCLGDAGYRTAAYTAGAGRRAAYEALGFSEVRAAGGSLETVIDAPADLGAEGPFFRFYFWPDGSGETALARLYDTLAELDRLDDTVICLLTGAADPDRAQLFLWGEGLGDIASDKPCSELDVTPTLLNLFGAAYDARFLSGLDILADDGGTTDAPCAATPLVSLRGSAYSDWVTDAGRFVAADSAFWPTAGAFPDDAAAAAYARAACALQYDRYVYARRVLENNYLHLLFGQ